MPADAKAGDAAENAAENAAQEGTKEGAKEAGMPHFYSDRVLAELLNLQSETELLFAQLQALSRSHPASVG
ncbi:MAG: hypothetical protein SNJ60_00135 [Pseudanabaenaceae cyanobacterium]